MLSPDIWTDEGFMALGPRGRLLWIGMISNADDDGRGGASARTLRAKVFPGDDMTEADVLTLRAEVSEHMRVTVYSAEGVECYQLERWGNHQSIKDKRASTIPPPDASPTPPRNTPDSSPGPSPNEGKKEGRKEGKKEVAQHVLLSQKEQEDLEKKYGASLLSEAIEYLSAYKQAHGKSYKSDAGALRQWAIQAALERREKARKSGTAPTAAARKCPKCGEEVRHNSASCLACGEELPWRRARIPQATEQPPRQGGEA